MLKWIKLGFSFRKWMLRMAIGLIAILFGFIIIVKESRLSFYQSAIACILILMGSIWLVFWGKRMIFLLVKIAASTDYKAKKDSAGIKNYLYNLKILDRGPKIVVIGGGTGISTMLRGLKNYSTKITAIITVADDGGGSGKLREDLGMLPPGDIRNCIMALADTEPVMEKLMRYRFKEGVLAGQSFGNLFLAAMNGVSDNFEQAVRHMSDVLAVRGKVLPVTAENINLCAELEDGFIIKGESKIGSHNEIHKGRIKRVYLDKKNVKPVTETIEAIRNADIIVLGPGSLYTSIIPNLLVDHVCEEIKKSKADKVYICNVMTQPGETDGYSVMDHIEAIEQHSCEGIAKYCIVNTGAIPKHMLRKYMDDGAGPVKIEYGKIRKKGIKLLTGNYCSCEGEYIRHNPEELAKEVINITGRR